MHDHRRTGLPGAMLNGSSERGAGKQMAEEHASNERSRAGIAPERRLSSHVRNFLGQRLRSVYAGLIHEPVPERFLKLLEELEATEKSS